MKPIPDLIPRFNMDYGLDDLGCSVKSIFSRNGFGFEQLERLFDGRDIFFTNMGRSSLYVILRALDLPKGSKVGVPLYTCTVVFDAIIKAGYVPCFIDVDLHNYTISPSDLKDKINNLSAVVVVHTFGRPADMDSISRVANDIPVIEDCAHSLLSEYKGRITGTMGVASFFSFKKYIAAGEGGMIILNVDEFKENVQKEIELLDSPSRLNEIKHSFSTYIHSFLYHKPWFGTFSFPIGSYVYSKINTDNREFDATRIRKSDLGIVFKKIKEFKEKVEHQRMNSQMYIKELEDTSLILPYENEGTRCNYYLFPVMFDDKTNRETAHECLRNMGVDTSKLYSMTPQTARQIYGYAGDCPNSERCADTLLVIPNYYTLTHDELLKVVSSVKRVEGLLRTS